MSKTKQNSTYNNCESFEVDMRHLLQNCKKTNMSLKYFPGNVRCKLYILGETEMLGERPGCATCECVKSLCFPHKLCNQDLYAYIGLLISVLPPVLQSCECRVARVQSTKIYKMLKLLKVYVGRLLITRIRPVT